MITNLHIKNIGIIDEITLDLYEGFNVITGETGAGKTLLVGSLQILAGGRFSKDMIRSGETNSFIEASIFLPNKGFEEDQVIVSREININGKNICKINGRLVTVAELRKFMSNIIDIHSQNDNQSILDRETHIEYLDEYIGKDIFELSTKYKELYERYLKINQDLKSNYGDDMEKRRQLDLLNYQVNEIENASLKEGEEEELEEKRKMYMSSEKIFTSLEEAGESLSDQTIDAINYAIKSMQKIEEFSSDYEEIIQRLKDAYYEIQEASRDISSLSSDLEFDEESQNYVEERLDLIKSLERKYGNNISEVLDYQKKVSQEIYDIQNMEEYINTLKKEKNDLMNKMFELSIEMNFIRIQYAKELSDKINKELSELEMKNAKFIVNVKFDEDKKFTKNGLDEVEFFITTNIGEELKPLVKIASGGEMSRIMLAIKNVLANIDKVPIIIFDEIDTGISGVAANVTGDKMKQISRFHQVICVTHLASIAARGDYNYFVSKEVAYEKTRTTIKRLNEEELLKEIARISTGTVNDTSIKHAYELRKNRTFGICA